MAASLPGNASANAGGSALPTPMGGERSYPGWRRDLQPPRLSLTQSSSHRPRGTGIFSVSFCSGNICFGLLLWFLQPHSWITTQIETGMFYVGMWKAWMMLENVTIRNKANCYIVCFQETMKEFFDQAFVRKILPPAFDEFLFYPRWVLLVVSL